MGRFFPEGIFKTARIGFLNLFRPNITIMYPHERYQLPERARWAVEMIFDEEGNHACTGCLLCQNACPDFIIDIEVTTAEDRSKHIDHWKYQRGACMMCGLCVEACNFNAIRMGHDYELAFIDPADITIELLTDTPAAKPKRAERPAPAPAATPAVEPAATTEPAAVEPAPKPETEGGDNATGPNA